MEELRTKKGNYNMKNYRETYATFQWEKAKEAFSFHQTGKINIAYEAIDRHGTGPNENKVALIYHHPDYSRTYTFKEMMEHSNQAGHLLKEMANVKKGDRVFIFMPRQPELYFVLLGAIKLGAIVGPLFEAFMEGAVYDRLSDSGAKVLVTTPELLNRVPLKELPSLQKVIIVGENVTESDQLIDYHQHAATFSKRLQIEWVDLEDPMLLHYTSGSTGKPKGIVHVHQAMIQQYMTALWVLDLKENDIYWCTADPGWVTGTAYGIFGPWLHGVTNVVVGGRFSPKYWYQVLEDYRVSVWYSAPTAFRMLMGVGDEIVKNYHLPNLRHILSVGEPLNPEVIRWGEKIFQKRIHDTWWMTETGAQMICNYPCLDIRPGSMGKPVPGVEVAILDNQGQILPPNRMGNLAIKKGWPAMMQAIWNQKERYESYFTENGWYLSGDSAYVDEDGYYWFQGRIDDVIMTSGERIGPFEVESTLLEHPAVAEAGVIGKPDPVRGEVIKAFISLREGFEGTESLANELALFVKNELSAHAAPNEIEFKEKLPKTRSGKIMRRVLKAWELKLPTGDLSTMEE